MRRRSGRRYESASPRCARASSASRSSLAASSGVGFDQLLSSGLGELEPPIRAEIFGLTRLEQHGRSLAQAHVESGSAPSKARPFYPRLQQNLRVLRLSHAYIADQERTGHHVSPAGEWLLDNFHLIESQLKEIHDGLPRGYFRSLPRKRKEQLPCLRLYQ